WLEKYPRQANHTWPYWAAGRADMVRKWPELFERLVRETNWQAVSIGFESGSNRVLKTLNKECTAEDNLFTIELLNRIGDDLEGQGQSPPFFWANVMFGIPGETREDALETMRMTRCMRRKIVQCAHYSPYPGSILGHQLIAEHRSLMSKENYHRYAGQEKVQGIDYPFYADLVKGKFNDEVLSKQWEPVRQATEASLKPHVPHQIYLFTLTNGKKKLAYGQSPEEALETLRLRLSEEEMSAILRDDFIKVSQRNVRQHIDSLG
ncbi:MAG TPA: radical SAM protein, partial [Gemmataceae bacterium]|nr:radical SAM protein [Gemmataceae bacterium]